MSIVYIYIKSIFVVYIYISKDSHIDMADIVPENCGWGNLCGWGPPKPGTEPF